MEEEPTDPHEQKLFFVYKSCLANGQSKLSKDGLLHLCNKLELDQSHKEAIFELLKIEESQSLVPFIEFRDAFVTLLDEFQKTPINGLEKEINGESDIILKNGTMCTKYNHQLEEKKKPEAKNCQRIETDAIINYQRLPETWTNQNSPTENINCFLNGDSTLSKNAIQIIFEKLDTDCDGLINLNDFLNFFESSNKLLEHFNVTWSSHLHREQTKSDSCKDFEHNQTGSTPRSAIVELWEVAGVTDASSLLLSLGFNGPTVNFIDLSNALSSELKLHREVSHAGNVGNYVRLLKGALILYQEEVRNLNLSMEHLRCERDKLRLDLGEANDRANLFAQEIDEQQARMDKFRENQLRQLEHRHTEALKSLSDLQQLEREKSTGVLKTLEEQLQAFQLEELRLKAELASLLKDLKELENENQSQSEELRKVEESNEQLSLQVCELAVAREQVESFETKENEQFAELSDHIRRLQTEIKVLRDHNDELTSELETIKHRDNDAKSVVSSVDVRSTISDENDGLTSMPSDTEDEEKRCSDHSKMNKTTNDTATITTPQGKPSLENSSHSSAGSINKLSEIIQEFRNFLTSAKFCAECAILRTEVSSLISELELYQSSVPPSIKSTAAQTTRRRKHLKTLDVELEAENSGRRNKSLGAIPKNRKLMHSKRISRSAQALNDLEKSFNDLALGGENESSNCNDRDDNSIAEEIEEKSKDLDQVLVEKWQLIERCADLEKSLELLRNEYEECEDYWESKLEEERQLFEQEQKISDEKFAELLVKMGEYEELFSTENKRDGRLSPIEERAMLEQQYTALEEEYERWKLDAQEELNRKEEEIDELKIKLANGKRRRESLKDNAVQFPDEQMKIAFPALYNNLCSLPSGSMDNSGVDKVDATVPIDQKFEPPSPCSKCHKTAHCNCNCGAINQQQLPEQSARDQKSRRGEGRNRHHHHHHQKRPNMDYELMNLIKQKEKLKQEIMRLQSYKTMSTNYNYSFTNPAEQSVVTNLYAKLFAQEQKHKYLQYCLTTQQKESERVIQGMWKQHIMETQDLRFAIKHIEDKLKHQIKIIRDQNNKLIKADIQTKELYVENAKLTDTIKRLEQHCQILTQSRIESTTET
ncbi:myosin heavy chain, skeletal muscle, adult [Copidosoma floridanum]|uniref:myosin heavy chain, skeletal muscle, adult n=1 Tax=Copidosoma floridanum TaxID=29053 RepID=UPI0006C9C6E0|nr:myosin heavy chain, skeletal muscle, adult [Copidosoma floridanum]